MFKDKTSKKRINNNNVDNCTLNTMHLNIIKDFELKNDEYNSYIKKFEKIKLDNDLISSNITYFKNSYNEEEYSELWDSNIKMKEDMINIKNKLKELEKYKEVDYYNDTSHILFEYYNMIENESKFNDNKKKTVLDALNNKKTENINTDKSQLVDEYLSLTNSKHIKKNNKENLEICKICETNLTCLQHEAILVCTNCGYQELLLVEQNRPILKQNAKDTSHFSYKRINHFREWCNQVQGKESTDIPDEIFEKILAEIKKEKIIDTKKITYTKMREILKRLRINKYYEHINYILNRIS